MALDYNQMFAANTVFQLRIRGSNDHEILFVGVNVIALQSLHVKFSESHEVVDSIEMLGGGGR